jgi:hypothetical protein
MNALTSFISTVLRRFELFHPCRIVSIDSRAGKSIYCFRCAGRRLTLTLHEEDLSNER